MKKNFRTAVIYFVAAFLLFGIIISVYISEKDEDSKYVYAEKYFQTNSDSRYSVYGGLMENLAEKYPDICGWINVKNTKISYPLLISKDNEYYLRRAYDGSKDKNGSIIVDYRLNRALTDNQNIILYGHNMASGNMFAYLANPKNFTDAEIEIYSQGVLAVYKPFAAYIEGGNQFIKTAFADKKELESYINTALSKSIIQFKTVPDKEEYILTLITCEDNFGLNDKRIVIHAVRQELILP